MGGQPCGACPAVWPNPWSLRLPPKPLPVYAIGFEEDVVTPTIGSHKASWESNDATCQFRGWRQKSLSPGCVRYHLARLRAAASMAPTEREDIVVAHRTVLLASVCLQWRQDEGADVRQLVAGLVEVAADRQDVDLLGTDLRRTYRLRVETGELFLDDIGPVSDLLGKSVDVVHILFALSSKNVVLAAAARLRGSAVVLSPMSMIDRDFAAGSWFRRRRGTTGKRVALTLLRWAYRPFVQRYVCVSQNEEHSTSIPSRRAVLAPLARPDSPLGNIAENQGSAACRHDKLGPVAFVSRLDVHRKGVDRMTRWVQECADELPRPAVRLLAPPEDDPPADLRQLIDSGLVLWDAKTRGAALAPALQTCRGLMLLSRWECHPRILREGSLLGLPTLSTRACNFREVTAAIGAGVVVDGDDPADVQRGFDELGTADVDIHAAERLFDRRRIAEFLLDHLLAAAGEPGNPARSYYEVFSEGRRGGTGEPHSVRAFLRTVTRTPTPDGRRPGPSPDRPPGGTPGE